MTTTADLIHQTRAHFLALSRDEHNRLTLDPGASGVTFTFDFALGGIQRGSYLAIDLEIVLVWSVSGATATVQRGVLGTTGAAHAVGSLVYVNPRLAAYHILLALNDELRSFSAPAYGLYRIRTVDLTYSVPRNGYDLTSVTDLIEIAEIRWKAYLPGDWPLLTRYTVTRDMATTEFASGKALILFEGAGPGRTLRVRYRAPYTALASLTDDVLAVAGLQTEAHDIPPLGAAARLLSGREARRASYDAQPESRQAADVPPGANRQSAVGLLVMRNMRLREESARLSAQYPMVHRRAS